MYDPAIPYSLKLFKVLGPEPFKIVGETCKYSIYRMQSLEGLNTLTLGHHEYG